MKLLAILEAYTITGPAKNLLEFAALARADGVETVLCTFTRAEPSNLFIETARAAGLTVEPIAESGPADRTVPAKLRELAWRLQPDLIQTHAVKSHFLARRAGLPRIAPWIAFHHGYTRPALRTFLYNQFDRWSLPAARKVLTVSRSFRDELIARGVPAGRIEIVPNAIRPDYGAAAAGARRLRRDLNVPEDRRVILSVGRLSREKDHATLLAAFAALREPAHLVLAGDGPERPRLEQLIARLGLTGRVTLAGQQPSAEPYYSLADIAAIPSRTEGSSNALLEAMAAGVPVVATAVGGTPETVAHEESALLVPPRDSAALSAAIARLLYDAALRERLIRQSRVLIRERHSPQARAARLVSIYREVACSKVAAL